MLRRQLDERGKGGSLRPCPNRPDRMCLGCCAACRWMIVRGIEKRRVVDDKAGQETFVCQLGEAPASARVIIYAWSMMTTSSHRRRGAAHIHAAIPHGLGYRIQPTPSPPGSHVPESGQAHRQSGLKGEVPALSERRLHPRDIRRELKLYPEPEGGISLARGPNPASAWLMSASSRSSNENPPLYNPHRDR
jgi:hypothetical protein